MKKGYKLSFQGEIPCEWQVKTIDDICTLVRGSSPRPKGDTRFFGGIVPRLMIADITRDGKYVVPKIDSLTEEGAKKSRFMGKGDLIISISGTVALPTFLGVDACIHDGFMGFREVSLKIDKEYFYYYILNNRNRLIDLATDGGIYVNLTTVIVKEFPVILPPLPEQKKIAKILSTVDNHIDEVVGMIEDLKELKKGLMQKLLTKGIGHTEFKDSPVGRIPVEWEVKRLSEICNSLKGKGLSKSCINDKGLYECVLYGELFTKYDEIINEVINKTNNSDALMSVEGDILIPASTTTTAKDLATASALNRNGVLLGGDINVLRKKLNNVYSANFLAIYLKYMKKIDIAKLGQGSTIIHVYGKELVKLMVAIPPLYEQEKIAGVFEVVNNKLKIIKEDKKSFEVLKKGLMQQLLTGKTRVKID